MCVTSSPSREMPEAGSRRSTMGCMPGVQAAREPPAGPEALALNYLRELSNVLRTRGNIVTTPEGKSSLRARISLERPEGSAQLRALHEALAAANLTRCSPEDGLEALVNSWLTGRTLPSQCVCWSPDVSEESLQPHGISTMQLASRICALIE
jgi:hypothetical protein